MIMKKCLLLVLIIACVSTYSFAEELEVKKADNVAAAADFSGRNCLREGSFGMGLSIEM